MPKTETENVYTLNENYTQVDAEDPGANAPNVAQIKFGPDIGPIPCIASDYLGVQMLRQKTVDGDLTDMPIGLLAVAHKEAPAGLLFYMNPTELRSLAETLTNMADALEHDRIAFEQQQASTH
jgi:hypothetical protein